jgi:hypothetical protein
MEPLTFDSELQRLPIRLRAAFAASCAERLLPAYDGYCERVRAEPVLVDRLSLVWALASGTRIVPGAELRVLFDEDTRTRVPPETRGAEYAQDAAIAILYALMTFIPENDADVEGPTFAARHAIDALDRYVARRLGVQPDDPAYAERVLGHEIVRSEVERQKRDLRDLAAALGSDNDWAGAVNALRARAVAERLEQLRIPHDGGRLS